MEKFGNDAVSLRLVVKTEPTEQWATARELRGRIKQEFDRIGIEIPFPQRTVWHHNVAEAEGQSDPSASNSEADTNDS